MKVEKTIRVPPQSKVVVDHYKCDICDTQTKDPSNWKPDQGGYAINQTTVEMSIGFSFPGDYCVTTTQFHICTDCFENKLVPWLASQGASPTISDS